MRGALPHGASVGQAAARQAFKDHIAEFEAVEPLKKLKLEREAFKVRKEKIAVNHIAARNLDAEERCINRAAEAAAREKSISNKIGEAKFTPKEIEDAVEMFNSAHCQAMRLVSHVGAFGAAPVAPDDDELDVFDEMFGKLHFDGGQPVPEWSREVCRRRQGALRMAVGTEADGEEYWLYLAAKKNTHESIWLQLRRRPVEFDLCSDTSWKVPLHMARREFAYLPPLVRTGRMLRFGDDHDLFVRTHITLCGALAVSPHDPMGFERWVMMWPIMTNPSTVHAPVRKRRRLGRVDPGRKAEMMAACPWLSDDDFPADAAVTAKRAKRDAKPIRSDDEADGDEDSLDFPAAPDGGEEAWEDLSDGGLEHAEVKDLLDWHTDACLHFYTIVLGGNGR